MKVQFPSLSLICLIQHPGESWSGEIPQVQLPVGTVANGQFQEMGRNIGDLCLACLFS